MLSCSRVRRFLTIGQTPGQLSIVRRCSLLSEAIIREKLQSDDLFRYTSGRWLYNESKRLQERQLSFNLPALVKAAAISIGRDGSDIRSIQKLAEGGFNRTFQLTMKDGFQLIARLPYPSTQPKRLAVASEVATMDLIRSYGVPAPKIYGYSCDAHNPVGAEYILMEEAPGRLLGDIWFSLSEKDRIKILSEIVDNEAKLFKIDFPAYGSIFYDKDVPSGMGRETFQPSSSAEPFCIGPDASFKFWFEERSALDIQRGPSMSAVEVLQRAAAKEMAWLRAYGKPRLPFERVHRDITNYEKSNPQEHLHNLEKYMQVAAQLAPKDRWLHRPIIRHPDLNPNNIFVSESLDIVSIIDWQHSTILPLFLHAGIPAHLQNYGDPDSENLVRPQLPGDVEEMDNDDREKELELYRRRHLHFYYVGATAKKIDSHFQALTHEGGLFRRKIFQHAGEPWEGNNFPLKADLIRLSHHWRELVSEENESSTPPPCPISFNEHEIEETLQTMAKQEEADHQMEILRNVIGINVDGWVSTEGYKEAEAQAAEMKAEAIGYAENDFEREMTVRHWPFSDHDERE
ncbi:kinase subdomain-containing protein [Xylona heveae TC161]|uniref:Kinase subdomain-containing protein n=1 Tax=Xylona heveae (strain CBS 132557 / TC161) TaxID=1328760 RepID=A0A165J5N1_XYLHT|nr:kinase subdomain-containing protein [Xylona heveae TC161]KZF25763.1 kinase subdomain-containing protein [Xylona heveae TC161]